MKQIPYGVTRFDTIIEEDYYYVDKTMYIPRLEQKGRFLFFLRPRRFGKSVFVDMLESYYDICARNKFERLFGNLWIGRNPTTQANRYQVLRFDFSRAVAPLDQLYEKFNRYCCDQINGFMEKYGEWYDPITIEWVMKCDDAGAKLNIISSAARMKGNRLYLIIDEYDNFTNVVLANDGKKQFHKLTHAEGFYRDFFKILKPTFDRIFMIGVSPVTMDDLTSGFNIAFNISQYAPLNSMLGFSEEELREMLAYYKSQGALMREIDDVLDEMRPWYNNYCFAVESCGKERVYNSTMVLNYLDSLVNSGHAPSDMVDRNTRTDYNKLRQLVDIDRGLGSHDRISAVMDIANKGYVDMKLTASFSALNITDEENFLSLIYYYGMLTMDKPRGMRIRMSIPNQSVRLQYWYYISSEFKEHSPINLSLLMDNFDLMAFDGDWEPLMLYLGSEYERVSSVRDAIGGEHNVQGFIKAYLSMCDYHIFCPEIEMGYGYSDFLMIPQIHRFPDARHSYIIEVKYAKPTAPDSDVTRLSEEADNQLRRYLSDTKLIPMLKGTTVHPVKVVFHGPKLVVCGEMNLI